MAAVFPAPSTREEELHWMALKLVPGLGPRKAMHLIQHYKTPQAVFHASRSELEAAGLSGTLAQSIASGCTFEDAVAQHQRMLDCGAVLIPFNDPRYPPRLREIFDPPLSLFARGRVELFGTLMLAIVGTRRPTPYGVAVTERLSEDLARAGLTITSGMARGIDAAAHRGAFAAEGNTIAVFGCGVDVLYPSENRKLAGEIAAKGLLVSEFPMGAPAYPQNFPIRNRIIAGMSTGVLVAEGAQYSGSGITARLALDQGREVFAVPGNITSKASWGPNLLIKEGAHLIQDWNDVVQGLTVEERQRLVASCRERLGLDAGAAQADEQPPSPELYEPARGINKALLRHLKADEAIQLDQLMERVEDYSSSEVIAALFELELNGVVKQLPGKQFMKVW